MLKFKSRKIFFLFVVILFLGIIFRFNNLNWDENFHLHPDERFLTMVGNAMSLPKSFSEYFDPKISKLNPDNLGYHFFVYGDFPLILNKKLAVIFGNDSYNLFTLQGRFLSAFFDLMVIFLVYKTAKLLFLRSDIALFCAFFYAISVYPIQSSHFFTVDTFLNFFMFGSFYFALRVSYGRPLRNTIFSAIFFGLALASKISAIYILPLLLMLIVIPTKVGIQSSIKQKFVSIGLFFLIFYITLRFANPYYFQNANFFDPHLNQTFVNNIKQLKMFEGKDVWYPPAVQWINKPWWGLLSTTIFAGLGPINFMVMIVGIMYLISNLNPPAGGQISKFQFKIKNEKIILFLILLWVTGYFVYQSFSFVKSIRYTIYLYPFYAILGGIGINVISYWLLVIGKKFFKKKFFLYVLHSTLYVLLLSWPILFSTIYFFKNTRVQASEWIYKNLPNNSVILGEHWDDPLPLYVKNNFEKSFQVELLPVFDPDIAEKWRVINNLLKKADYYILSSNRGWGSIPTVPEKYPKMSQYYKALLANDCQRQKEITGVCFKKIKEFMPYYYYYKFIRYPDSWIEETFTVYDHQTVLIYGRIK